LKGSLVEDFKNVIINAGQESKVVIHQKSWEHYLIGFPPVDNLSTLQEPRFYRDPGESYKRTSLIGLDMRLLVGNALFFYLMHIIFNNVEIALFFTFLFEGFLRWIRNTYGEDNISKKTMIDERFLI
jgi:meckelin